jgi:hypothetical protein
LHRIHHNFSSSDFSKLHCSPLGPGIDYIINSERQKEVAEITPTMVTQGATYDNDEKCCGPANAFDMDLSTFATVIKSNGVCWMEIHMGNTHFIHKIMIYHRFYKNWYYPKQWCVQSLHNFKACVNNNNNVDVSVYQGDVKQKSCGTLKLTYGLEQSDQIYTLICNTEGDTVKLSTDTEHIFVCEIVIAGPGTN